MVLFGWAFVSPGCFLAGLVLRGLSCGDDVPEVVALACLIPRPGVVVR